jgi:hypothetical protein
MVVAMIKMIVIVVIFVAAIVMIVIVVSTVEILQMNVHVVMNAVPQIVIHVVATVLIAMN